MHPYVATHTTHAHTAFALLCNHVSTQELKGLVSGPLASELGSSAVPRLSQQLRDALSALVGSDDGLVARGGAAAEAARKLEAQAEAKASERRLEKERSVAMDARAMEVGHILEVR